MEVLESSKKTILMIDDVALNHATARDGRYGDASHDM